MRSKQGSCFKELLFFLLREGNFATGCFFTAGIFSLKGGGTERSWDPLVAFWSSTLLNFSLSFPRVPPTTLDVNGNSDLYRSTSMGMSLADVIRRKSPSILSTFDQ